jgi:hypothetical protein
MTKPYISEGKKLLANSGSDNAKKVAETLSHLGYGVKTGSGVRTDSGKRLEDRYM